MKSVVRIAITGIAFFGVTITLGAQTPDPYSIPERGVVPNGFYSIDKIETVDVASGNMSIHMPLTSLPAGRGGSGFGLDLFYNSSIYTWYTYDTLDGSAIALQASNAIFPDEFGGWHYGYNYQFLSESTSGYIQQNCPFYDVNIRVVLPDGSSHALYLNGRNDDYYSQYEFQVNPLCGPTFPQNATFYTVDGTYLTLILTGGTLSGAGIQGSWALYFPDGRVVNGTNTEATSITDRNGNTVWIDHDTDPVTGNPRTTLRETLQTNPDVRRTISIVNNATSDVITQASSPTQTNTWTVNFKTITLSSGHTYACYQSTTTPCDAGGIQFRVATSLILPNQLHYLFCYNLTNPCIDDTISASDGWGVLSQITLPSGASSAYSFNDPTSAPSSNAVPFIASKTLQWTDENANSARTEGTTYSYLGDHTDVTHPDGSVTRSYYYLAENGSQGPHWHLVYNVEDWSTSGSRVKRVERVWGQNVAYGTGGAPVYHYPGNPFVATELDSVDDIVTAVKIMSVDRNGNVWSTQECDWSSYNTFAHNNTPVTACPANPANTGTTLVRTTQAAFYTATPDSGSISSPSTTDDPNGYWNPHTPQLLNLPSRTTVTGAGPGAVTEYQYDQAATPTNGNLTEERRWDSTLGGQTNPLTASNAVITDQTFDGNGNLLSVTNPRKFVTSYTYGTVCTGTPLAVSNLYPTQIVQGVGPGGDTTDARTFTFGYDCYAGVKTSDTDQDHALTRTFGYDQFSRNTSVQEGSTRMTGIAYYDPLRQITVTRDRLAFNEMPGGLQDNTWVDQLGRVRLTQDPGGNYVLRDYYVAAGSGFSYELVSNPYLPANPSTPTVPNSDPTVGWTVTTRDTLGRAVRVEHFTGAALPAPWGGNNGSTGAVTTSYSANCAATNDESGVSRTNCSDGLGRLTSVAENGIGATTTYGYDALYDLTSVTQGSTTRSFVSSSLRRLGSATNPESGTVSYTYDANGNLLTRKDGRGIVTTYCFNGNTNTCYNGLDQLEGKSYSDYASNNPTPWVGYSYNKGWLTQVSSSVSTYNYTAFDELGRIKGGNQMTGGQTYAFTLEYYPFMGVKDITYPYSNRTLTTGYDTGGRPNSLSGQIGTNPAIPYVTQVTFAPQGAIGSLALNNGLTENWQYNARLQPTQIQLGTLFTIANRYDPKAGVDVDCNGNVISPAISGNNGNVLDQTLNGVVRSYSYDGVNRICRASQGATWTQGYAYDARGNVAFPLWTGQLPNATADVNGSVSAYGANNQVAAWAYDGAGNVIGIPAAGGSTMRAACASTVMPGVAMVRTACYDAENRMTAETDANGNTVIYGYDGDGWRVSKTVNALTTILVYDPEGELAQEYGGPPVPAGEMGARYLTADHLGSTRVMTNENGAVTQIYDYLPFGEEFVQSGDTNRVRFTGKERDTESGLDFFGARYFSGAQGRWTSVDPAFESAIMELPQTWNRYSYVYNRPTFATDPDGRCPPCIGAIVGGVVEGGWNLGSQLYQHYENGREISWREFGANVAGGAVAGAIAGATGGVSLLADAVVGAAANTADGIVTRAVEGKDAEEVFSSDEIEEEAISGFLGGGVGHKAAKFIRVPEEPKLPGSRRHAVGRRKLAKYDAAVAARNSAERLHTGVHVGVHDVAGNSATSAFWGFLDWLVSPPPPPPPPPPKDYETDINIKYILPLP